MEKLSQYEDEHLQANLMVHDDLTFILHKNEIDKYVPIIIEEMLRINFEWINVPLAVEMSIGSDWYNLEPSGEYESIVGGGYKQVS